MEQISKHLHSNEATPLKILEAIYPYSIDIDSQYKRSSVHRILKMKLDINQKPTYFSQLHLSLRNLQSEYQRCPLVYLRARQRFTVASPLHCASGLLYYTKVL